MLRVLSVMLLFIASAAHAVGPSLPVEACAGEALYGFPQSVKKSTTRICRTGYVLEHDNNRHIPVWVAYVLTPQEAVGCEAREGKFAQEPDLPSGASATMKDYAKSGYDIGHLANSADMRWSAKAMEESNLFSNATPSLPEFNRGIWKKLEDGTRGWAVSRKNPIQIYIAPVVTKEDPIIGPSGVTVPGAFVKILLDSVTKEYMVFSFKHEASRENLVNFLTTRAEAQRQTGVIFPLPQGAKEAKTLWKVDMKSARAVKADKCASQ